MKLLPTNNTQNLAQPAPWNTRAEKIAWRIYPVPGLPLVPLPVVMKAIENLSGQKGGYERLEKLPREQLIKEVSAEIRRIGGPGVPKN